MKRALLMLLLPSIAAAHPCPPNTTHHEGMEHSESSRTAHWCWNAANKLEGRYEVFGSSLEVVGNYTNGQRHGAWIEKFADGTMKSTRTYANGQLHGRYQAFINSVLVLEGDYATGKRHGTWKLYSLVTGKLLGENELADGNGTWREWYQNRKVREEGPLVDDRKHGTWREFHENGTLFDTHVYKDGQLDGPFTQHYASGKKLRTGTYRNGKKHGTWKVWYEQGQRQAEYQYVDDQLVKSREWTRRGKELGLIEPNSRAR